MSRPPQLQELCLQITNACPLRCTHCSTRAGPRAPHEMSDDDILRLLSDFAELGGKVIEFSGGEPITHPGLRRFVAEASFLDLEVRLYSSGVAHFRDGVAVPPDSSLWDTLRTSGLEKVFFNLQGETPELHERVTRIPGSFSAVHASLRAARAAGLFTGVHFVPMAPNFRHLDGTYKLASDLGVDEFAVLRLVLQGRAADNRDSLALTQSEFFEVLSGALNLQKESSRVRVRLGCPLNHRLLLEPGAKGPACRAGEGVCHVRPNGDVVPCSGLQHAGVVLGNVRATSLADALRAGSAWASFRDWRSQGPVPGSVEFIRATGDPCLAQLATATETSELKLTSKEELRRGLGTQVPRAVARIR